MIHLRPKQSFNAYRYTALHPLTTVGKPQRSLSRPNLGMRRLLGELPDDVSHGDSPKDFIE